MKEYRKIFQTSIFRFESKDNIMEEKDLGICADISSMLTPEHSVAAMNCFQGCPYTNTGFRFDLVLDGEKAKSEGWVWLPNAMYRHGKTSNFALETVTAVIPGMRTAVMKVTVTGNGKETVMVPLQVEYRGKTRKEEEWAFSIPKAEKGSLEGYTVEDRMLSHVEEGMAFCLTSSVEEMTMFRTAYLWEGNLTVPADGSVTVYFSAHMGPEKVAREEARCAMKDYEALIEKSFDWLQKESKRIYDQLPRLSSDEPELDNLYYRSLVTYIMCRWENPDLCAIPYFSTGSINGGCMCSYLWDYCGGLMLHPLYDPEGNKAELLSYLRNDLTTSYALNPVTGGPTGPWYQINQEKVILMVYYHVLFTGEKSFLFEKAGDKTVLEWMKHHAYVCDDLEVENKLFDYGKEGYHHLELRREYTYDGIMPDLNARRYLNYMRVYELTVFAGEPDARLPERAAQLKEKLKVLWNDEAKWYDFIARDGKRDIRYTVQMFKFLNSPVIGEKEREGLVSHLNEQEFLSKFGLHSMSKLDEAYDQDDIDNGGGGICTHFTMQICAQLYEMGYDTLATDILRRVYWWGTRLPYLGDSCAANMIMNREDTPLQGDISSTSCAQMIFYYIFGIRAQFDGTITVSPVKHRPANKMKIENARLCGREFAVEVCDNSFTVCADGVTLSAKIGEKITLKEK